MNELFFWLPTGSWERLAADALWQSTALAGAGLAAAWLVRRRAALRAAILLAAVVLSVTVPLLSSAVRIGGGGLLSPPTLGDKPRFVVIETQPASNEPAPTLFSSSPKQQTSALAAANPTTDWAFHPWRWFVGCSLAVSAYLAFRLLLGVVAVRRWIRLATPCRDAKIEAALSRAALAIGVREPELLCSSAFDSPALVMLGRARILLPPQMPAGVDWFAVFCHELAHRVRRDDLSRLVVELAVIALPWQPLLWLVRRRFRAACEEACDDWAVAAGADPVEFASLLVTFIPERRPAFALGMAESPADTRHRILRLLAMTRTVRPRLGLLLGAASAAAAITMAIALALLQYNSGPRMKRNLPPWGDLPLAEALARSAHDPWVASAATEKDKSTLPTYVIEPPDILMIEAIKTVPKSPYSIEPGDTLEVEIANPHLQGEFIVDADGNLSLGPDYAILKVAGLTLAEARDALKSHLAKTLPDPRFSLTLSFGPIQRQISDQHLVGPDGTINLGTYGEVHVAGRTLAEAKAAIEAQLSNYLEQPRVSVDVFAYNSQVYYVIIEGAGLGDTVVRIPITGNETVLDALAQIGGLKRMSDKNIWIARPMPGDTNRDQILPVSWTEITQGAVAATNYQVMPGDRVIIQHKLRRDVPAESEEEITDDAEDSPTPSAPIRRVSESS